MVIGPSGVGTSSLIRAGAVASLRREPTQALDGPDLYPVLFTPGDVRDDPSALT